MFSAFSTLIFGAPSVRRPTERSAAPKVQVDTAAAEGQAAHDAEKDQHDDEECDTKIEEVEGPQWQLQPSTKGEGRPLHQEPGSIPLLGIA